MLAELFITFFTSIIGRIILRIRFRNNIERDNYLKKQFDGSYEDFGKHLLMGTSGILLLGLILSLTLGLLYSIIKFGIN